MTRNQIEYWNLQEQKRSNKAQEEQKAKELAELQRSNTARELENSRTNRANEDIKRQDIARGYAAVEASKYGADTNYASSLLSNKAAMAQVGLGYANLAENTRSNKRNESITSLENFDSSLNRRRQNDINAANVNANRRLSQSQVTKNYSDIFGFGVTKIAQLLGKRGN